MMKSDRRRSTHFCESLLITSYAFPDLSCPKVIYFISKESKSTLTNKAHVDSSSCLKIDVYLYSLIKEIAYRNNME